MLTLELGPLAVTRYRAMPPSKVQSGTELTGANDSWFRK
jgi:hypothetical protein